MIRRAVLGILGLTLGLSPLGAPTLGAQDWGDEGSGALPATAEARQGDLSRGLLAATPVERLKPLSVVDPSGTTIGARVAQQGVEDKLLWELRWDPAGPWGPGTWVAFRDGLGRLREARLVLLEGTDSSDFRISQPGTWVRLVPQKTGTRLDLFVAGRLVTGGWTVNASLLDILTSDDGWLWDQVPQVDLTSLLPQRRWEDEKVEGLRGAIRKALSTVPPAPAALWWPDPQASAQGTMANGAPWGRWTSLDNPQGTGPRALSSWGASLWVADGILRGWKAPYPTWAQLTKPRIELPGYSRALVPEDPTAEPGFGLDWIRNLGLAVDKALHPARPQNDASADVVGLEGLVSVSGVGYDVADAPALWHQLAVTRPGQVYLVSLSVQGTGTKGAAASVTFGPPAVVLPYIAADDRLRVAVFAGPQEMSWGQWLALSPVRSKAVRPDHLALTALPLPAEVPLPLLPGR